MQLNYFFYRADHQQVGTGQLDAQANRGGDRRPSCQLRHALLFLGYGISSQRRFSLLGRRLTPAGAGGCQRGSKTRAPRSRVGVARPAIADITAVLLRKQCYDKAALTLLCYGAYLRPSEGMELRPACLIPMEITVSPLIGLWF